MEKVDCAKLEERAHNAWPGIQQALYDGWLLRFAHGYTRRANSIVPVCSGDIDPGVKVELCREYYARRGLPAAFKMLSFAESTGLDALLAAEGYRREAETSVQVCVLGDGVKPSGVELKIADRPDATWLEAYVRMNNVAAANRMHLQDILHHIVPVVGYALLYAEGEPVACGMGVLEDGYVGLFSLVTDPAQRQRGFGRRLLEHLCLWARDHGAHTAYLQVVRENETAWRLYARCGFAEVYRYWYRIQAI